MSTAFPKVLLQKGVKMDWNTPKPLFDKLNEEFHFQMDAATCDHNPMGTSYYYTNHGEKVGAKWKNPTWVNPPYSAKNIKVWLKKAVEEQEKGVTSVFLLPSRTGTNWFHDFIYQKPDVELRLLKGRLKFDYCKLCYPDLNPYKGSTPTAPFDSLIAIFHGYTNTNSLLE